MIRSGRWKYIYFMNYGDLLYDLSENPGETKNLSSDPEYVEILQSMREKLTERVSPDEISRQAFRKQKKMRDKLVRMNSVSQLADLFRSRMGDGQALTLAERLKGRY